MFCFTRREFALNVTSCFNRQRCAVIVPDLPSNRCIFAFTDRIVSKGETRSSKTVPVRVSMNNSIVEIFLYIPNHSVRIHSFCNKTNSCFNKHLIIKVHSNHCNYCSHILRVSYSQQVMGASSFSHIKQPLSKDVALSHIVNWQSFNTASKYKSFPQYNRLFQIRDNGPTCSILTCRLVFVHNLTSY